MVFLSPLKQILVPVLKYTISDYSSNPSVTVILFLLVTFATISATHCVHSIYFLYIKVMF
jgi:hypothetical protein